MFFIGFESWEPARWSKKNIFTSFLEILKAGTSEILIFYFFSGFWKLGRQEYSFFIGFARFQRKQFSKVFLRRQKRRPQAEELRSTSFFSAELVSDAYEPQGFGRFTDCCLCRRPPSLGDRGTSRLRGSEGL